MQDLQIDKICRVCLQAYRCLSSFFEAQSIADDGASLVDMIYECTNYKVYPDDELPQLICQDCIEDAHSAYSFKKLYEASHQTLIEHLASVKKKTYQAPRLCEEDIGSTITEDLFKIEPTEPLAKSDHEVIFKSKIFGPVEMKNEADASCTDLDASAEASNCTVHYNYLQEEELIIKDEHLSDEESYTEETNVLKRLNDEEYVKLSVENTGDCPRSSKDQTFPEVKTESKREESSADSYHQSDNKKVNPNKRRKCDKRLPRKSSRKKHTNSVNSAKPYKCDDCEKAFNLEKNLIVHKRRHDSKKPGSTSLKRQRSLHTDGKLLKCRYCDKSYATSIRLEEHERTHTGEKPYKCKDCDKTFARLRNLSSHKNVHTREKSYKCRYCSKSYGHSSSLSEHQRVHTGKHPYKCKECEMTFYRSGSFNFHKKWAHSTNLDKSLSTDKKPFKCQDCNATFSYLHGLYMHKKMHTMKTPFKCTECNKSYPFLSRLEAHKKSHEKPYKCLDCNKAFGLLSNLNAHKRIHSGKEPYKCDECSKTFSYSQTLKRHKQTLHTGDKSNQCNVPKVSSDVNI